MLFGMRILQLCKKFPYPMKDGESIAVTQSARAAAKQGLGMDLLAFNTVKHCCDLDEAHAALSHYGRIEAVPLDNRVRPLAALKNLLLTRRSYHVERFIDPRLTEKLIELLEAWDYAAVQLETVYMAPYIPVIRAHSDAKIVLRCHNVEHEIWERLTRNTGNPLKRAYLRVLTERLRRFEIDQLDLIDAMLSISPKDDANFRELGFQGRSIVVPISLELESYRPEHHSSEMALSFIGSLDWFPNLEGLEWFLENVDLSGLRCPITGDAVKFNVAGRNPPANLAQGAPEGVIVHGEVPSAVDFINAYPLMMVPLFSGSGMRTKILEAMALEKVVVTTSLGLEGINARDGVEVLVADSGEEFRQKIAWALEDSARIERMGKAARRHIEEHYDSMAVARRLIEFLGSIVEPAAPSSLALER